MYGSVFVNAVAFFFTEEAPAPFALSAAGPRARLAAECSTGGFRVRRGSVCCREVGRPPLLKRVVDAASMPVSYALPLWWLTRHHTGALQLAVAG